MTILELYFERDRDNICCVLNAGADAVLDHPWSTCGAAVVERCDRSTKADADVLPPPWSKTADGDAAEERPTKAADAVPRHRWQAKACADVVPRHPRSMTDDADEAIGFFFRP